MNNIIKVIRRISTGLSLTFFVVLIVSSSYAQEGESLFKQGCASCHSIGKGRVVGPDLLGVKERRNEEWLIKFIQSSQKVIKSGDKDATALFAEFNSVVMPDQNLNVDQIKSILSYITDAAASVAKPQTGGDTVALLDESKLVNSKLAEQGKRLFEGSLRLVNGGPSCITCHNVNHRDLMYGGELAADLTNSYTKLGGTAGLGGVLSAPPFPAMAAAFKDKPLTNSEINALNAFLFSANVPLNNQIKAPDYLLLGGTLIFLGAISLIFMIWYKRKVHTVKKTIYDRQIESIN